MYNAIRAATNRTPDRAHIINNPSGDDGNLRDYLIWRISKLSPEEKEMLIKMIDNNLVV